MATSDILKNRNSYTQAVENYSSILRKVSMIHPKIYSYFKLEIEGLITKIDKLLLEWDFAVCSFDKLFELRRCIFQIDNILNFQIINKYNSIIDSELFNTSTADKNDTKSKQVKTEKKISDTSNEKSELSTPVQVWQNVSSYLMKQLNVHTYNVWVKPVKFHSCENKHIKIMVENQFYKNWLEDHCSKLIKNYLDDTSLEYEVSFVTN